MTKFENKFNDTSVIIIAAGKSSRLGTPKGLMRSQNAVSEFWLIEQIHNISKCGLDSIFVVLGYDYEKYFENIPLLKDTNKNIKVVINKNPEKGPFSSITCGIKNLSHNFNNIHSAFILPVDVPCPKASVWKALYDNMNNNIDVCIPVNVNNKLRGGHPVLVSKNFMEQLEKLSLDDPDSRLDVQIRKIDQDKISRVAVTDDFIYKNLNTIDDWKEFKLGELK